MSAHVWHLDGVQLDLERLVLRVDRQVEIHGLIDALDVGTGQLRHDELLYAALGNAGDKSSAEYAVGVTHGDAAGSASETNDQRRCRSAVLSARASEKQVK